jgi:hypothetical protein
LVPWLSGADQKRRSAGENKQNQRLSPAMPTKVAPGGKKSGHFTR